MKSVVYEILNISFYILLCNRCFRDLLTSVCRDSLVVFFSPHDLFSYVKKMSKAFFLSPSIASEISVELQLS